MSELPAYETLGPKMRALRKDEQRLFVWFYVENGGNATQAARDAGYGGDDSKRDAGVHSTSWRLLQRTDIKEAVREVTWDRFAEHAVMSTHALKVMILDSSHKDHMRAVQTALSLAGFVAKSEHKLTVEHTQVTDKEVMEAILGLCSKHGLDAKVLLGAGAPAKLPAPRRKREAEDAQVIEGDWLDQLMKT